MGNYASCTLNGPPCKSASKGTRVIFPSGEIRRITEPTKAAEIMLECPSSFLVNTQSLQIGKRFNPLNADEDLEIGNVYALFPMKRLNAVVSAGEVAALFVAANSGGKRGSIGCVRVSPEQCEECGEEPDGGLVTVPKLNLEEIEELLTPEFRHRLSMCRSKKPLLETIVEERNTLREVMMLDRP